MAGTSPQDDAALAAINAWLTDAESVPPAPSPTTAPAHPPRQELASNTTGTSFGKTASLSSVDRTRQHLRLVRHELLTLKDKPANRDEERIAQLEKRAKEIEAHLDALDITSENRALYGAPPEVASNGIETDGRGVGSGSAPRSGSDARAAAEAQRAADKAASTDFPIGRTEPFVALDDELLDIEDDDESAGSKLWMDIEDVQMCYEHLMFATERIEGHIAAAHRRVEILRRSGRQTPAAVEAITKEASILDPLVVTKSKILAHSVRISEVSCAATAVHSMESSRQSARRYDLGDVRNSMRILRFVRRRYAELAGYARDAFQRMDEKPSRNFTPLLVIDVIRGDRSYSRLKRRLSERCETAKSERTSAQLLLLNIQRLESALEEHCEAVISSEKIAMALLVLQQGGVPDAIRASRACSAIEEAEAVVRHLEQELGAKVVALAGDLEIAKNSNRDDACMRILSQRVHLAQQRQETLRTRREVLASCRKKLPGSYMATIAANATFSRNAEEMARDLASLLLCCCDGSPEAFEVSVHDETIESFDYSSHQMEKRALLDKLLATDVQRGLEGNNEALCETMAALKVVYASGNLSMEEIARERPGIAVLVEREIDRLNHFRASAGGDSSQGAPVSLPEPTSLEPAAPPPSAPRSSTPCSVCHDGVACAVTPCCGAAFCDKCGPPLVQLFGKCPECGKPLQVEELERV